MSDEGRTGRHNRGQARYVVRAFPSRLERRCGQLIFISRFSAEKPSFLPDSAK
jgi:hypothetical protein